MSLILKNIVLGAVCALLLSMVCCVCGVKSQNDAQSGTVRPYIDKRETTNEII